MTFPVVESVTESAFSVAATSHSVSMPATVSAGDLLLMHAATNSGSNLTVTATGWTNIGINNRTFLLAKVADGSEGGTTVSVSFGSSVRAAVQVHRISGWYGDLSGVEDATANSVGPSPSCDHPSLTASWGAEDNLWLALCGGFDDDSGVAGYPTNYTNGQNTVSGGGENAGCNVSSARRENAAATENPDATVLSVTQTNRSYTVAIRPAAAGNSVIEVNLPLLGVG